MGMKVISDLLQKYPQFSEDNTLLVDDSYRKMRMNKKEYCIEVPTYCISNKNIDFLNDNTLMTILPKIYAIRDNLIKLESSNSLDKDVIELESGLDKLSIKEESIVTNPNLKKSLEELSQALDEESSKIKTDFSKDSTKKIIPSKYNVQNTISQKRGKTLKYQKSYSLSTGDIPKESSKSNPWDRGTGKWEKKSIVPPLMEEDSK